MANLDEVFAKITHAEERYASYMEAHWEYLQSGAFSTYIEPDMEARTATYRLKVTAPIPINLRILAGEVITHLRSALDHLVWQLALLDGKTPSNGSQFPIFETKNDFRKSVARYLSSISPEIREIIFDLQPFNLVNPKEHLLWILNRLANDDKHRLLTIVNINTVGIQIPLHPDGMSFQFSFGNVSSISGYKIATVNFEDFKGAVSLEMLEHLNPGVHINLFFSLEGETTLHQTGSTLDKLGFEVLTIANRFKPYFT